MDVLDMDYEGRQIINGKGGVNMQGINAEWAAREATKDRKIVELEEKLAAFERYYGGSLPKDESAWITGVKKGADEIIKADLLSQIDDLKRENQTLKASIEVVQGQRDSRVKSVLSVNNDVIWPDEQPVFHRFKCVTQPVIEAAQANQSEAFPLVEPFLSERKYIVLSGPIGVGKSTLTKQISRLPGFVPFFEEPDQNPYLPQYYAGESVSFPMQQYFLAQFMEQAAQIRAELECGNRVVQDRSIYEVLHIFSKHQMREGHLSADEWATQERMCRAAFTTMPKPDLILILDAEPKALIERIATRGREYEASIDAGFLSELRTLYRQWVKLLLSEGAYEEGSGKTPQSGPWAGTRFAVLDVISGGQVMTGDWI